MSFKVVTEQFIAIYIYTHTHTHIHTTVVARSAVLVQIQAWFLKYQHTKVPYHR